MGSALDKRFGGQSERDNEVTPYFRLISSDPPMSLRVAPQLAFEIQVESGEGQCGVKRGKLTEKPGAISNAHCESSSATATMRGLACEAIVLVRHGEPVYSGHFEF
ncbi:hypothetical protein STEG23_020063 [Scotinomys teguina]